MHDDLTGAPQIHTGIVATLDGLPVSLPFENGLFSAVRCHLEALALQQQRILCSLSVDGQPVDLAWMPWPPGEFCRVEARTLALDNLPQLLLQIARQQAGDLLERVKSAVSRVLINDAQSARELWWKLVPQLKVPVLTLSLLPDTICGASSGRASFTQLRKWQLQQVAIIIQEVEVACRSEDMMELSNALESRVLPWLQSLHDLIALWLGNVQLSSRMRQAA